ncbi:hypothetical protein P691DRAFT_35701 [Macrolepiota fuliginosa MF-IS2]|uniref:Uncharacterized protein n=1 Tax=Macrolepiota fuliginosa MF-IS2 TaxID=1400762 RepID=A0A9P5XCR1_9AGAR|nr:hypothetical protein P691DRAFT_35701 [Macrolepiota fuliginosa MF-IS2]
MAQLIRRAKSGSDWTATELAAYHITVVYQDFATFFGTPNLPRPAINPNVLTTLDHNSAPDDDTYRLLRNLGLAMAPVTAEESAVDDFAVVLLRALGYEPRGKTLRTRKNLPFVICGENRRAQTDVCLIDEQEIVLLIQEGHGQDPEPQLVAGAIAAFTVNNRVRVRTLGLPPLPSGLIAGITLNGTAPIFYKIGISTELVTAVGGGVYPETEAIIHAHLPVVPRPHRRWSEGMKPLDNRQIILSCYEAFKGFVS